MSAQVDLYDPMCLVAQLNISTCRRFLLQLEHELLKLADSSESNSVKIRFPNMQDAFKMLLTRMAARFELTVSSATMADGRPDKDGMTLAGKIVKPELLLVDIVRHQYKDFPETVTEDAMSSFVRLKAVAPSISKEFESSTKEEIEAELDRLFGLTLKEHDELDFIGGRKSNKNGTERKAKGRGFKDQVARDTVDDAKHSYNAWMNQHAETRAYWRDGDAWASAPWPATLMQRDAKKVQWRKEWQFVRPKSKGGILSWSCQHGQLNDEDGFAIHVRNEHIADDGFRLEFRIDKNAGCWHVQAARKGNDLKDVKQPVKFSKENKSQFWLAVISECNQDDKSYVVVGTYPGLFADTIHAARFPLEEDEIFDCVGFAPLCDIPDAPVPEPVRSGCIHIGDITVYPRTLSGDLPFLHIRHLQQNADGKLEALKKPLPLSEFLLNLAKWSDRSVTLAGLAKSLKRERCEEDEMDLMELMRHRKKKEKETAERKARGEEEETKPEDKPEHEMDLMELMRHRKKKEQEAAESKNTEEKKEGENVTKKVVPREPKRYVPLEKPKSAKSVGAQKEGIMAALKEAVAHNKKNAEEKQGKGEYSESWKKD